MAASNCCQGKGHVGEKQEYGAGRKESSGTAQGLDYGGIFCNQA